jgi:hypothetical protein
MPRLAEGRQIDVVKKWDIGGFTIFNFREAIFYRDSFSYTMFHLVAIYHGLNIYRILEFGTYSSTHGTLVAWLLHWFIKDR